MTYHQGFLYVTDGNGNPSEVINEARTAANMQTAINAGLLPRYGNVAASANCAGLAYQPCAQSAIETAIARAPALGRAVLWLDAADIIEDMTSLPNRGTGGTALNGEWGTGGGVPIRLTHLGTNYLYMPGVSGNIASVPDAAALDITGDLEMWVVLAARDWTPSSTFTVAGKWGAAGQRSYRLSVNTTGNLVWEWSADGTTVLSATSTVSIQTLLATAIDGKAIPIRVTFDVDNGAAGRDVKFWYGAANGANEPTAWTQLGSTVTSAGVTSIFNSTTNFEVGSSVAGTDQMAAAKFYRVVLRNLIGGAIVLDINFATALNDGGQTTALCTTGQTMTFTRPTTASSRALATVVRPIISFDGSDDYIEVADNDLIDFAATESMTAIVIARPWTTASTGSYMAKKNSNLAGTPGWMLYGQPLVSPRLSDGTNQSNPAGSAVTSGAINLIGMVRSSSLDTVVAYTNGSAVSTSDITTATSANGQPLRIGTNSLGTDATRMEFIAAIVVRGALTAAEIAEIYSYYLSSFSGQAGSVRTWQLIDTDLTAAPWYNPNVAASTEGYGYIIEEWTGLDDGQITRSMDAVYPRGGVASTLAQPGRTFGLTVLCIGRSDRGLLHLMRWLESAIMGCCTSCELPSLWLREYCPPDPNGNPAEGLVRIDRMSMLQAPKWESPPVEDGGCYIRRMSFVLGFGDPCFYEPETDVAAVTVARADLGSSTTTAVAGVGRWAGTNAHVARALTPPGVAYMSPIVTIAFDRSGTYTPQLRIVGFLNPAGYPLTATPRMWPVGGLVISGAQPGWEVKIDFGARTILYRDLANARAWQDGSSLIYIGHDIFNADGYSPAAKTRWITFAECDDPVVVVDPYRHHGGYYDDDDPISAPVNVPGSSTSICASYTVTIQQANRHGGR